MTKLRSVPGHGTIDVRRSAYLYRRGWTGREPDGMKIVGRAPIRPRSGARDHAPHPDSRAVRTQGPALRLAPRGKDQHDAEADVLGHREGDPGSAGPHPGLPHPNDIHPRLG